MNIKPQKAGKDGGVLGVVLIVMLMISVLTLSLFKLGQHSVREAMYEQKSAQAFWLADAGARRCVANLNAKKDGEIDRSELDVGVFAVTAVDGSGEIFDSIGTVMMGGQPVKRRIQVSLKYAAKAFEDTLHVAKWGEDASGSDDSNVVLSGKNVDGVADLVTGIVSVNGAVGMTGDSSVKDYGGLYNVLGDVKCSQGLDQTASTVVEGETPTTSSASYIPPNLADMNYAKNNTYDLDAIFAKGVDSAGRLLDSSHPLYKLVAKNPPGDDPTSDGDDYYFLSDPSTSSLALGDDQIFYVDGHVWFKDSSGFKVDGSATIVSTKDIHISGSVEYVNKTREPVGINKPDMLALVAQGSGLDVATGRPTSGGNIYLGDSGSGTLVAEAFMFASNNFYYDAASAESGDSVDVFGNCMAMNQMVLNRDFYTKTVTTTVVKSGASGSFAGEDPDTSGSSSATLSTNPDGTIDTTLTGNSAYTYTSTSTSTSTRSAKYGQDIEGVWKWVDSEDRTELSDSEIGGIRHCSMQVNYDDRIRDLALQMPGLPRAHGTGGVIAGYTWKELPAL